MRACNNNILRAMDLAGKLLFLADKGDLQREDDGCGVLYGIIRDAAYKMNQAAQTEIRNHILRGTWDGVVSDSLDVSPKRTANPRS